jgi:hypothetical protein
MQRYKTSWPKRFSWAHEGEATPSWGCLLEPLQFGRWRQRGRACARCQAGGGGGGDPHPSPTLGQTERGGSVALLGGEEGGGAGLDGGVVLLGVLEALEVLHALGALDVLAALGRLPRRLEDGPPVVVVQPERREVGLVRVRVRVRARVRVRVRARARVRARVRVRVRLGVGLRLRLGVGRRLARRRRLEDSGAGGCTFRCLVASTAL